MVNRKLAAGVLVFFDDGNTILLGKEYRKRYNCYAWMEFGGNLDGNESLLDAACREANEETADVLNINIRQLQTAENKGHFIDFYNENTAVFYRMYCIKLEYKPDIQSFKQNSVGKKNVEKVEWKYFDTSDVLYNREGLNLYETMCIRLDKLKNAEFFKYW